jgi:lipopolysaccharide/colanic/teichoic acid biosynthesis glycosyltransferase
MTISIKRESLLLFLGDICALVLSLFLALVVRYGFIPSINTFVGYLVPFSFLFAVSILIYFVAGLYDKHTLVLARRIPQTLARVQVIIAIAAVAFFYFMPFFNITPKTFLFIYLVIVLVLTTGWRMSYLYFFRSIKKQSALLVAKGDEATDLFQEINGNSRYGITFVDHLASASAGTISLILQKGITFIAADFNDLSVRSILPELYKLFFTGIKFVDIRDLYEDIFDRIPLSLIDDTWCLSHISSASKPIFDLVKRLTDIIVAGILAIVSLVLYPFVYIAVKLDDGGALFSYQTRVGERGKSISIMKFRTMSIANDDGKWDNGQKNVITRAGKFLRKSRIDELPQLWNVVRGDISLVGPRPEFPEPVALYTKEIPYYNLRHIVKPGLSGWAQIYHEKHPHHGIDTEETGNKLSYDLYYIKNRSFLLDLKIALRTMKVLLSFAGK